MSYCSDVRFRLLKDDYKELEQRYLDELGNDVYFTNLWHNKDIYRTEEDGTVYFGWDGLKWYRQDINYKNVDLIMDFIIDLENYAYAIIGEEIEDIDTDQNGIVEDISIKREFEDDKENIDWIFQRRTYTLET